MKKGEKPLSIQEVEKNTGLTCIKDISEWRWWVTSPTGVKLFWVEEGSYDGILGGISMADIDEVQGIDDSTRRERRKAEYDNERNS